MAGRITKLDDLTAQRIVKALEAGLSRRGAANAAFVSMTTLMTWLAAGRRDEAPFSEFLVRVEAAEAKAEKEMVDVLFAQAKEGKYQPAIEWLRARRRAEWFVKDAGAASDDDVGATGEAETDLAVLESLLAAAKSRKVGT